jgi:predicted ATP-dependent serine protease
MENTNIAVQEKRRRGRPSKQSLNLITVPSIINFKDVIKLNNLEIDPKMLETMPSNLTSLDSMISHEGGVSCASNIMIVGDPGVGKTTVMLDLLSSIKIKSNFRKILFISGEMGRKQMYKYTKRFPQFGVIDTLFISDYLDYNTKDVVEQILNRGYDLVLVDSIAEIIDGVRDDNNWDRKTAESWLVNICRKNNKGENVEELYTSFLMIQQVTKQGLFVGSNKLKHLFDAMMEMRKDKEKDGGNTYITFTKNRDGMVGARMNYNILNSTIQYSNILQQNEDDE